MGCGGDAVWRRQNQWDTEMSVYKGTVMSGGKDDNGQAYSSNHLTVGMFGTTGFFGHVASRIYV
jgi:hypothetical protein